MNDNDYYMFSFRVVHSFEKTLTQVVVLSICIYTNVAVNLEVGVNWLNSKYTARVTLIH